MPEDEGYRSSPEGEESSGLARIQVTNARGGGWARGILRFLGFMMALGMLAGAYGGLGAYIYFYITLPPVPEINVFGQRLPVVSRLESQEGVVVGQFGDEWRDVVAYEEIPPAMVMAIVAAEDDSFFDHKGVNYRGVMRALWRNLWAGRVVEGGSTITQQVGKALISHERTFYRKARELVLARRLEAEHTKEEILFLYLNRIYFGGGAYGVAAAARTFFNRPLSELNLGEVALLAGLPRAPSRYSPFVALDKATSRQRYVLRRMRQAGFIDHEEEERARKEPLRLDRRKDDYHLRAPYYAEQVRRDLVERYGHDTVYRRGLVVETTLDMANQIYGREAVEHGARSLDKRQGYRGPVAHLEGRDRDRFARRALKVYGAGELELGVPRLGLVREVTGAGVKVEVKGRPYTIPLAQMRWARRYSQRYYENKGVLSDPRKALKVGDVVEVVLKKDRSGESVLSLDQTPRVQSGVMNADLRTGYVTALVGGNDFDHSKFNRITQSCRQPGSTFKPIYYALALKKGYTYNTMLNDTRFHEYDAETGQQWSPTNVENNYSGQVTLYEGLVMSKNLPSIAIFSKVGAKAVAEFARTLGITTPIIPDRALALGASCVKPWELAWAFGIFALGGERPRPVMVRRVLDQDGRVLEDNRHPQDPWMSPGESLYRAAVASFDQPERVVDETTCFLISMLMRDVVRRGLGWKAASIGVPTAGKTGTSSHTSDGWFLGFTQSYLSLAWIGTDDYDRPLGAKEQASTTAIPIWVRFMKPLVAGEPEGEVPTYRPKGVSSAVLSRATGQSPKAGEKGASMYFRSGTSPDQDKKGQ